MSWQNKIIAITPFLCFIAFIILGVQYDLWNPGWVVFLLIPLMPFIVGKKKISITVVFIAIYGIVVVITKKWHPWWVILVFIPVFHILMIPNDKKIKKKYNIFDDED